MVNSIRAKLISVFIFITVLLVAATIMIMAVNANERQLRARTLASYKHPCIVLEVDNNGCQSKIEMRTRPAMGAK